MSYRTASFWDYVIFWPEEDDKDFDGIHYGGIKAIRGDAPESAKEAFARYQKEIQAALCRNMKI